MNIVSRFRVPFQGNAQPFLALEKISGKEPVFTVLIGENGTRKSFLLRAILDSALGVRSAKGSEKDVEFRRPPKQVIGISAIAGDRFPASSTIGDLWQMGHYREGYTYIGPRTGRNLISRKHNSRQLILALLENPGRLLRLKDLALALRKELLFPPDCAVGLNANTRPAADSYETLENYVQRQRESPRKSMAPGFLDGIGDIRSASAVLANALGYRPTEGSRFPRTVDESHIKLHFNWAAGEFDGGNIPSEILVLGLKTGYLRTTSLEFSGVEDDSLSSGQWSLFCGTYLLGLLAKDDTLVLIDEPECSLHPQWQRIYMELTRKALTGVNNCHVLVATHSSLVLSSLPAKRAEVIALERKGDGIAARPIQVPTGWDASDVIEEIFGAAAARGPEITEAFQHLLSLVAGGRPMRSKFKKEVDKLEAIVERLPFDDPLRLTFAALQQAAVGR